MVASPEAESEEAEEALLDCELEERRVLATTRLGITMRVVPGPAVVLVVPEMVGGGARGCGLIEDTEVEACMVIL